MRLGRRRDSRDTPATLFVSPGVLYAREAEETPVSKLNHMGNTVLNNIARYCYLGQRGDNLECLHGKCNENAV